MALVARPAGVRMLIVSIRREGAKVSDLQTPDPNERDPNRDRDRGHEDTPDTPPTEPPPVPVQDPPAEPGPAGPYIVSREQF